MGIYNQNGQDYNAPVKWEPPPPQFRSGSNWGSPLVMVILAVAVGWLLWDKCFGRPSSPASDNRPSAAIVTAATDTAKPPSPAITETDPAPATDSPPADEDIVFYIEPRERTVQLYASERIIIHARVDGAPNNYHVEWRIQAGLPELHCAVVWPDTRTIELWATGIPDSLLTAGIYEDLEAKLYSGTDALERDTREVTVINPIDVFLPGNVNTSPDPWNPTRVFPLIKWEGEVVFGPDWNQPKEPPSGMTFTWSWGDTDSSTVSTEPIFELPSENWRAGSLCLVASYQGWSGQDQSDVNSPSGNPIPVEGGDRPL